MDTCVLCDWLIPDSLGEQFPEVGSERTEAEVPWEAHKKLVWPVPTVSTKAWFPPYEIFWISFNLLCHLANKTFEHYMVAAAQMRRFTTLLSFI